MNEWKIKTADGPDGEVIISTEDPKDGFDVRLAIDLGYGDYRATYLLAEEARKIAKALLDSVKP